MRQETHRRRRPNSTPSRHAATGVTLIELLIGIAIGLLVSLAAVGSLVFNRISATLVNDTVSMQQDASSIMRMVGRQLRQSGAVGVQDSPGAPGVGKYSYISTYVGLSPTVGVISVNGADTGTPFDSLSTSFSISPSIANALGDCRGTSPDMTAVPPPTMVISRINVDGNNNLTCGSVNPTTLQANPAQPMASNVEEFHLWYAIRTPPNGANPAQIRYYTANQILAPLRWDQVQAVQVCLRLSGDSTGNPVPAAGTAGCLGQNVPANGRIQRVYRKVFTLRNLQSLG